MASPSSTCREYICWSAVMKTSNNGSAFRRRTPFFQPRPTKVRGRRHVVRCRQHVLELPRDALVDQYAHAYDAVRSIRAGFA